MNYWLWLVKTKKGDFFISVEGDWDEIEAAKKVREVLDILKMDLVAMVPRRRAPSINENSGTIIQQEKPTNALGFDFLAGKGFWEFSGRSAEYEAEMILLEKQIKEGRN